MSLTNLKRIARRAPAIQWHIEADPLAVGARQGATARADGLLKLTKAVATVEKAPTGADLVIDINDDGTSVFGATKLVVAAGATSGTRTFTGAAVTVADASLLTLDIDQVGSTEPGEFLTVHLYAERLR